ncbi:MAG TPA: DPP IV N-terminal domain-containing protein, partial [Bryobacteraceae bacterium]
MSWSFTARALSLAILATGVTLAQGTLADYQRAQGLETKGRGLVVNQSGTPNWIGDSHHLWYSKSVPGGTQFVWVDAATGAKRPAFDHDKLAAAISASSGGHYTGLTLPFVPAPAGRGGGAGRGAANPAGALTFLDDERSIQFGASGFLWKCLLADYTCTKGEAISQPAAGRGGREAPEDNPLFPGMVGGDPVDGLEYVAPWPQQDGGAQGRGPVRGQPACAPVPGEPLPGEGRGGRGGRRTIAAAAQAAGPQLCRSFDGKWEALIQNFNVFLRPVGSTEPATPLSFDGSEGNYYTFRSIAWSPDSTRLAAYHTRPGYSRVVHYIESSPADQVQPKLWTNASKPNPLFADLYRKPGDALDIASPALFDVAGRKEIEIDQALFPNAYNLTPPVWWKDGRGFTFEYNQRGHQVYRVIEVDAQTGKPRALISEESKTFIYY